MNKVYKASKKLLKRVADNIDTIYSFTKDGFEGSFTQFKDATLNAVALELTQRGVLEKTKKGKSVHYKWVASSAPTKNFYFSVAQAVGEKKHACDQRYAPKRKALYEAKKQGGEVSVTHKEFLTNLPDSFGREDYQRAAQSLGIADSTAQKWISLFVSRGDIVRVRHGRYVKKAVMGVQIEPAVIKVEGKSLRDYTIEELWGELKSRGVEIEGGHLVVIERRVIA